MGRHTLVEHRGSTAALKLQGSLMSQRMAEKRAACLANAALCMLLGSNKRERMRMPCKGWLEHLLAAVQALSIWDSRGHGCYLGLVLLWHRL